MHQIFQILVNEHYKGNRYRNQVVRQDFPTALNEQNKEKENAERQAALYHQMINEQEEADAKVAREFADKLKYDTELERRRQSERNELLARRMQDEMHMDNNRRQTTSKNPSNNNPLPIPPKNLSTKYKNSMSGNSQQQHQHQTNLEQNVPPMLPSPKKNTTPQLNYVSLDISVPTTQAHSQRILANPHNHQPTQYTQIVPQKLQQSSILIPPNDNQSIETQRNHYERINLQSHTPEKRQNDYQQQQQQSQIIQSSDYDHHQTEYNLNDRKLQTNSKLLLNNKSRQYSLDNDNNSSNNNNDLGNISHKIIQNPQDFLNTHHVKRQLDLANVHDMIDSNLNKINYKTNKNYYNYENNDEQFNEIDGNPGNNNAFINTELSGNFQKLSPDKYDSLMGIKPLYNLDNDNDVIDGASAAAVGGASCLLMSNPKQYQQHSQSPTPPQQRHHNSHHQQQKQQQYHAQQSRFKEIELPLNDISMDNSKKNHGNINNDDDFYNPDRIKTMQELGVPPDEILEIDRRITQEERDEVKL